MSARRFAPVLACLAWLAVSSSASAQVALPNDDCASPLALAGPGLHPLDTTFATTGTEGQNEAVCLEFAQTAIARDLWFTYVPATTGIIQVSTCGLLPSGGGGSTDSKIAAYAAVACPIPGSALACNDDAFDCGAIPTFESSITVPSTCGTTYLFQVGQYPGSPFLPLLGQFRVTEVGLAVCAGVPYCGGDGTSGACPCGNESAAGLGQGCRNSSGSGARLAAIGTASVAADDVVLNLTSTVLFFQGTAQTSAAFADGRLCVGGSIVRLAIQPYGGSIANYPGALGPRVSTRGLVPASGGTRHYQAWYRDAPGPCGTHSNLSNGVTISWAP